jgi:hypothetical protein
MRRLLAALVLACLGILIPAGGTSLRLCLLEGRIVPHHNQAAQAALPATSTKCCDDCRDEPASPQPCCLDLKELPDATAPPVHPELPAVAVMDLELLHWIAPPAPAIETAIRTAATEVRGPTPPALRRAMISVWRL